MRIDLKLFARGEKGGGLGAPQTGLLDEMPAKAAFRLNSGTVKDPRRRGVGVGIVAVGELVGLGLGAGLVGVAVGLVEVGSGLAGAGVRFQAFFLLLT